ncbi:MAG: right-handed parallel beta-helix repeat-containing protein [Polyangiaceae bacterium]
MGRALFITATAIGFASSAGLARAATLTVGPGKMYAAPCAAIAAANDGDTIEIDSAGTYAGDVCAIAKNGLTLRGTPGRARIDAAGKQFGGKGIWVISGNDTTVENIEFSGATVPDQNGAGIRQEGTNLTVRRCFFHDNENGILSGGRPGSAVLVEYSEFANNGFGDGFSHNMYIGHEGRFTLRYSYSHHAKVGHLVKSRAAENYILYNRLSGEDGTASYELDLPNAGTSWIVGNILQQTASTGNATMMTYGVEGTAPENPGLSLFVVNNTFVNDRTAGGTFVAVGGAITTAAVITNNIFFGQGTITSQSNAMLSTNRQGDPTFVAKGSFDYRLAAGSPCIDTGSDPGTGAGFALLPAKHYVHPANAVDRAIAGAIDIGAYEFGADFDAGTPDAAGGSDVSSDVARDVSTTDGATRDTTTPDRSTTDATSDARVTDVSLPEAGLVDASRDDAAREDATPEDSGTSTPRDAATEPPGTGTDDGGCGCRFAPHERTWSGAVVLFAALLAVARRRGRTGEPSRPRRTHP